MTWIQQNYLLLANFSAAQSEHAVQISPPLSPCEIWRRGNTMDRQPAQTQSLNIHLNDIYSINQVCISLST